MKFFNSVIQQTAGKPGEYLSKLAESLSRQSERFESLSIKIHIHSAQEALACLLICSFLQPWENEAQISHIGELCYRKNYQGKWKDVQTLLEMDNSTPEKFFENYKQVRSGGELYGNIIPTAMKLEMRAKYSDPYKERKKRVLKGQRIRGYRDKGSRRLPHEFHGDPPVKLKTDRRHLIQHPLLRHYPLEGGQENYLTLTEDCAS